MRRINAVLFPPGESPRHITIEPTLDHLQALVGGPIQHVPTPRRPDALVYVNEDGLRLRQPPNEAAHLLLAELLGVSVNGLLHGPVLVMGDDGSPDEASIPEDLPGAFDAVDKRPLVCPACHADDQLIEYAYRSTVQRVTGLTADGDARHYQAFDWGDGIVVNGYGCWSCGWERIMPLSLGADLEDRVREVRASMVAPLDVGEGVEG